jgi:hypothetical protein
MLRRALLCCLCGLWLSLCGLPVSAVWAQSATTVDASALTPAQQAHLAQLQQQALSRHLAQDPMWRTLLHFQVQPLTRVDRSLADDAGFFVAPQGAHDASAELQATLAAFFDDTPRWALDQSAACRFVARYEWLRSQLSFDPALLPPPACPRYQEWRRGLNAGRVTLVFPAAYLNSPASMYGHTFLRLDPPASQGGFNPLLSYAISYAANGNEAEGLAFAFKGLTGLYAGQFTNSPYYIRIRDYNDLENRDIWEYELKLSPDEIERLLAHTWELGTTRFDYFFFDENCSYHLLSLLDAARPGLNLTQRFTWWAMPVDTVRAVTDTPGLLDQIRYRPSNSTELRYRAQLLGPTSASLARQVAAGSMPLPELASREPDPQRRALVLETAERLVAYEGSLNNSTEEAIQKRRMAVLVARAALPALPALAVPAPSTPPSAGHQTARTDVLTGQRGGQRIWQFMLRPAYHDLMDPQAGYERGAAIQFGRIELSQRGHGGLRLERFTPVEIQSLSPNEGLIDARSWRVHAGWRRSWGPDAQHPYDQAPLAFEANGGPGWAAELTPQRTLLGYAFIDNQFWWDKGLVHRGWAAGSGLAVGLIWDASETWRMGAEAYARAYLLNQPQETGVRLDQRWQINRDINVQLRCQVARREAQGSQRECMLGLQHYW